MEYQLPKEVARDHSISLKTVYNYLSKYPEKIRVKKEYGKRLVHSNDFSNTIQESFNLQHPSTLDAASTPTLNQLGSSPADSISKQATASIITEPVLQKENYELKSQNDQLSKRNDVLERQITKYAELHKEEKAEKLALLGKHEVLRERLNALITYTTEEKLKGQKAYYRMIVFCSVLIIISIFILLPTYGLD